MKSTGLIIQIEYSRGRDIGKNEALMKRLQFINKLEVLGLYRFIFRVLWKKNKKTVRQNPMISQLINVGLKYQRLTH